MHPHKLGGWKAKMATVTHAVQRHIYTHTRPFVNTLSHTFPLSHREIIYKLYVCVCFMSMCVPRGLCVHMILYICSCFFVLAV